MENHSLVIYHHISVHSLPQGVLHTTCVYQERAHARIHGQSTLHVYPANIMCIHAWAEYPYIPCNYCNWVVVRHHRFPQFSFMRLVQHCQPSRKKLDKAKKLVLIYNKNKTFNQQRNLSNKTFSNIFVQINIA